MDTSDIVFDKVSMDIVELLPTTEGGHIYTNKICLPNIYIGGAAQASNVIRDS